MALETPNRMAASARIFYAEAGALPPPNDDQIFELTAADGIQSASLLTPEGPITGAVSDGFFLELQNPVRPENGSYMLCGPPGIEPQTYIGCGLTPLPLFFDDGSVPNLVEQGNSLGNFLCVFPSLSGTYGWIGVGIWEHPRVEDNESPFPVRVAV